MSASFQMAQAQVVATFEDLTLPGSDTCYINYTASGTDVGFNDGPAHFPCVYDTSSTGNYWNYGFAYSNKTDSLTSGLVNQYSARPGIGCDSSNKYAVAYCYNPNTYAASVNVYLTGTAVGKTVEGFYITNNTYAANSMQYGDGFETAFASGDWFKVNIQGYTGGALTTDSVIFYLANFMHADTDSNYIVKNWQWVNLAPLGPVDSLIFTLSSTKNNSFGMLTPAYFCMDNFTSSDSSEGVATVTAGSAAKLYPVPATTQITISLADPTVRQILIRNNMGVVVYDHPAIYPTTQINTGAFAPGNYYVELIGDKATATSKFVKQ